MALTDRRPRKIQPTEIPTGSTPVSGPEEGTGYLAYNLGRRFPTQFSSRTPIIGEVESGVYGADEHGESFPAGTLWVRTEATAGAGDDESSNWIPVPDTLPAGYTIRNDRNLRPFVSVACSSGADNDWGAVAVSGGAVRSGGPQYSWFDSSERFQKFVRTSDGIYQPQSFTVGPAPESRAYPWGPCAGDDVAPTFTEGITSTVLQTYYGMYHPGYRACTLIMHISTAAYAFIAATPTTTLTVTIDGSAYSAVPADLTLVGGRYEKTWTGVPTVLASPGYLRQFVCDYQLTGLAGPTNRQFGFTLKMSPRVDIPLPFTCTGTYSGLVAPGGILTGGNVPGY